MVHALHTTKKILKPDGYLINIHDLPIPVAIEVRSRDRAVLAGWLLSREDFKEERAAFNAITNIVTDGGFTLENECIFAFDIYADCLIEFQEWLSEYWESAVIPEGTLWRIRTLLQQGGQPAKIVLKSIARMTKLRVV